MSVSKTQFVVDIFLVVLLDVSGSCLLQQVVSAVHEHTQAVECANHLGNIGNDRLFLIGLGCHKLVGDA